MEHLKVILITGTSRGIGRFLVNHFIKKGSIVHGCSRSHINWSLEGYTHHIADVTNERQVKNMFATIRGEHRKLDITINNAGIASMNHMILTPDVTARKIIETNFIGTFLICRESAKLMKKNKYGRIVNFGSIAVPMNLEGETIYAASKSAVVKFTKIIARELAEYGITCNVVCPSPISTDLIRGVPKEKIEKIINNLAIKRPGRFEDIANVIDFFIKPESDYITGQVISLGGF